MPHMIALHSCNWVNPMQLQLFYCCSLLAPHFKTSCVVKHFSLLTSIIHMYLLLQRWSGGKGLFERLLNRLLVLLPHAQNCQEREGPGGVEDYQPCTEPLCPAMKALLKHMTQCQAGDQCLCEFMIYNTCCSVPITLCVYAYMYFFPLLEQATSGYRLLSYTCFL